MTRQVFTPENVLASLEEHPGILSGSIPGNGNEADSIRGVFLIGT
jgi:hypothetical protein